MRSLADDLRARDNDELCALILARPDLVRPVPTDLTALAQRAGSPGSVAAALRDLDQFDLQVCLAAGLAGDPIRLPVVTSAVATAMADLLPVRRVQGMVRAALRRLRERALLWGSERSPHLVGAARDLLIPSERGPRMAGLDPLVAEFAYHPASVAELLESAPPAARAALERLLAGSVVGAISDARRVPDPQRSGVDWLLAHHLVVPMGDGHVVVPAEVAAILRGARPPDPVLAPIHLLPPLPAAPDLAGDADKSAVGAVLDVLNLTADLGRLWSQAPPATIRTGGIAARDMTRTARSLAVAPEVLRVLVEVAAAAGLIAPDSAADPAILPTAAFDAWIHAEPPARHAALALAWLGMPREVARVDQRPLSPELAAADLPALRLAVLTALASAPGGWTDQEVLQAIAWRAPRRVDPIRTTRALAALDQLRTLGLVVGGTLTGAGRALADGDAAGLEGALRASLPAHVDELVMQADLTAIVPGLPTPELEHLLRVAADPESTGVASVFRFSAASIRRALDTGMSAADLSAALARHGQVPQPLAYLIADVGRRHAILRVGRATTYLRCDDPVELASLLADPRAAALGLERLSDTVIVSDRPPEDVLEHLNRIGRSPQPEPGQGLAPPVRRARARPDEGTPLLSAAMAAAAVRSMRAHDAPASTGSMGRGGSPEGPPSLHPVPSGAPAEVVATLRSAIAAQGTVWLGYAEPTGVSTDRRVEPLRLAAGYLTAFDLRTETIRTFAVARITGVIPD